MLFVLTAIWEFVWNTIKDIWGLLTSSPAAQYVSLGVAVTLLIVGIFFCRGCKSDTEQRIEDRNPVLVEGQQAVNAAEKNANEANANAVNAATQVNAALENVNRIRANKQTNVSVDEANRNRCIAFPESCNK